jgi:hypothetical protein
MSLLMVLFVAGSVGRVCLVTMISGAVGRNVDDRVLRYNLSDNRAMFRGFDMVWSDLARSMKEAPICCYGGLSLYLSID